MHYVVLILLQNCKNLQELPLVDVQPTSRTKILEEF